MKRFYKDVTVGTAESGFAVLLDGRPVRTPGRNMLILPTERLAAAIGREWQAILQAKGNSFVTVRDFKPYPAVAFDAKPS